jgi:hypothetical protein
LKHASIVSRGAFAAALLSVTLFVSAIRPVRAQVLVARGTRPGKHFDQVLIVVLENQNYSSAIQDPLLADLAKHGSVFPQFQNLTHPSYPNYLAMVSGSTCNADGSDSQKNFPDDAEHRTIADLLSWRNYAENYPAKPTENAPYLGDAVKYARKHVPFLSFEKIQKESFHNVVSVDTKTGNPFVPDISKFREDPRSNPLPQYIYYSPNLDDDGHDPYMRPKKGMRKASTWLRNFLTTWLAFDENTWLPSDPKMNRLLVIVTFDETEGRNTGNLYTVFLGSMVKTGEINKVYDHYSVLRTIEDNFGLDPIHKDSGDGKASVITEVWK